MYETAKLFLAGKHPHKKLSLDSTLELYGKNPIFIPMEIINDAIELIMQKVLGS